MRRGALLLCLSLAAQGQPVAQVEGRPVTAAEIEPDARDTNHFRSQLSAGQFTQWRDQARAGRLASRIWQAVKTDFCRTRQCEPTEADLDAWVQASAAREQERRVRDAARIAGLEKVPVVVRDDSNPQHVAELRLIENIQRENLNPLELARAYQSLIDAHQRRQASQPLAITREEQRLAAFAEL